ncbi:MAG: tetrahydrofolate dehydrogenase/cyclohydrolase catalytic domain-containing protein [Clostridium sp.]
MRVLKGAEVSVKMKEKKSAGAFAKCKGSLQSWRLSVWARIRMICPMSAVLPKKWRALALVQSYVYPEDITDSDFKAEFTRINEDPDVTGILMLRPLPKQICEKDIEGNDRS